MIKEHVILFSVTSNCGMSEKQVNPCYHSRYNVNVVFKNK